MNRVVHFEIPSDDPGKSLAFYKEVFGWSMHQWGAESYWLTTTGPDTAPGINGAIMQKKHPQQPVVNTIEVDDMERTIAAIEKNGGQVVVPLSAVPGIGWLAYFKDPDGNISGIMKNDKAAK
jgi:predicted enzyme related to lactoylglutathione lyase